MVDKKLPTLCMTLGRDETLPCGCRVTFKIGVSMHLDYCENHEDGGVLIEMIEAPSD